jgi:ribosomal protein L29
MTQIEELEQEIKRLKAEIIAIRLSAMANQAMMLSDIVSAALKHTGGENAPKG